MALEGCTMADIKDLSLFEDLKIDVYQYLDYRLLMKDYFDSCRKHDKRYSYRYFANRLELRSPGYIQSLLKGDRKLSDKLTHEVCRLMQLSGDQRDYFELLIRMDRSEFGGDAHEEYYRRIQNLRSKKLVPKTLDEAQVECVSSWLHWVLREMTLLKGASLNVMWFRKCLSRFLNISTKQVLKGLEDLKQAKLLDEEDGRIFAPDPVLNFADERVSSVLKFYHKEAMEQGVAAMANKAQDREYGSVLVATTPEKFQRLKEKLKKERREALELLNTEPGEASMVVSFSFQLFPVAKTPELANGNQQGNGED